MSKVKYCITPTIVLYYVAFLESNAFPSNFDKFLMMRAKYYQIYNSSSQFFLVYNNALFLVNNKISCIFIFLFQYLNNICDHQDFLKKTLIWDPKVGLRIFLVKNLLQLYHVHR